jgi:hypothetical protein
MFTLSDFKFKTPQQKTLIHRDTRKAGIIVTFPLIGLNDHEVTAPHNYGEHW